ncbi:MAG: type II toxin-antitoxin system VapC family toxin [Candidatus Dormibacteraceae bacterium]
MDAFDADVLIYADDPSNPLRPRLLALFGGPHPVVGVGSVILLPEVLSHVKRQGAPGQAARLRRLLKRLDLRPVDRPTAEAATTLGARYSLRAADAIHLATALQAGAARFITNNRRDFKKSISGIAVTYPDELSEPRLPHSPGTST